MCGYEEYYDEQIYEPTPLDELFIEYRDKCKTILLASVQSEIDGIKNDNTRLTEKNNELHSEIRQLKDEVKSSIEKCKNSIVIDEVLKNINKDNFPEFLAVIYEKDYEESWSTEDTPLWLGVLTEYYSHKDSIIEMFNIYNIKTPKDITNFRLPIDWNEEELDIFFSTMRNHYNCNGNFFQYNLRHWGSSSLKSVKEQCNRSYSELPWQYVLRNPLLKTEKYLKLIGEKITETHGNNLASIYHYQDLDENQIKIILENIDYTKLTGLKNNNVGSLILKYIHLIDNDDFLDKIYPLVKKTYREFDYIKNMKPKYIKKYLLECKENALGLLKECTNLSKEDKQEIIQLLINN